MNYTYNEFGSYEDNSSEDEAIYSIDEGQGCNLHDENYYSTLAFKESKFYNHYYNDAVIRLSNLVNRPLTEDELSKLEEYLHSKYIKVPYYSLRSSMQKTILPLNMDSSGFDMNSPKTKISVTALDNLFDSFHSTGDKYVYAANGAVFKSHNYNKEDNMFISMLCFLGETRDKEKNEMNSLLKSGVPKDDYVVKAKSNNQKNYKMNANSAYGVLGASKFILSHSDLPHAVTATGRLILCSTVYSFEACVGNLFLSNIDELFRFVIECNKYVNTLSNPIKPSFLFENGYVITYEMMFERLKELCSPLYKESESIDNDIHKVLSFINVEDYENIYWRGNIFEILNNTYFIEAMKYVAQFKLNDYQENEFKKHGDDFYNIMKIIEDLIIQWVYLPYIPANVIDLVANKMRRKLVIIGDTDSNFIYLDPYYQFISQLIEVDTNYIDDVIYQDFEELTKENDLEKIETFNECLGYLKTITNVILHIFSSINVKTMRLLTTSLNVPDSEAHHIQFKSEYGILRILLTSGKKNYASHNFLQEGALLNKGKGEIDIKGLSMKKVEVAKFTSNALITALTDNIIASRNVSRVGFIKALISIENMIENSIMSGELKFGKPKVFKSPSEYENPLSVDIFRACTFWNACYPSLEITHSERPYMFPVVVGADLSLLDNALSTVDNKEDYNAILNLKKTINSDEKLAGNGFNWIAIPKSQLIPKWMRSLINIDTLKRINLSPANPVLESLSIYLINTSIKSKASYSTMVEL